MPKVKRIRGRKKFVIGGPRRNRKKIAKEEDRTVMPHLSNDVMTNILIRIPADLLHKNFRYQCKDWFNIFSVPNFPDTNVFSSKVGIIYVDNHIDNEDIHLMGFMEFEGVELKIRELNTFKTKLRIMSSCNGLVIGSEPMKHRHTLPNVFVLNPTTKESIGIPPCKHDCLWHDLVYVPSTREYKVVDMFYESSIQALAFHVRSIGGCWNDSYYSSDSLRFIKQPSSYKSILSNVYWNERISIDGILYLNIGSRAEIVSFDLCNEMVRLLKLPPFETGKAGRLIELGGFLSFVDCPGGCSEYGNPLDVWILKDTNIGEWEKKFRIDALPEHFGKKYFRWYNVVGSLNGGELMVFANGCEIFTYNVKTRIWNLTIAEGGHYFKCCLRVHVNNLAPVT